jgi:hypothetical protein
VFPEILNGFSVSEVVASEKLFQLPVHPVKWTQVDATSIDKFQEIKIILISDSDQHIVLINELLLLGWKPWKNFRYAYSDKIIYGMIRQKRI